MNGQGWGVGAAEDVLADAEGLEIDKPKRRWREARGAGDTIRKTKLSTT
jgi:hypothetical protein